MENDLGWGNISAGGTYTITTTDGTGVTTTSPSFNGYVTTTPASGANWELSSPIPEELKTCQVCGVEDVVVLCDECKNVMNWARKKWAEQILKEIEDDLS